MPRRDRPVGAWLALGFGTAAVLLTALVAVAVTMLSRLEAAERERTEVVEPRAVAANALDEAVLRLGLAARTFALTGEERQLYAYRAAAAEVARSARALEASAYDAEGGRIRHGIPPLVHDYLRTAEVLVAAKATGGDATDLERALTLRREAVLAQLDAYTALQREQLAARSAAVVELRRRTEQTLLAALAAVLAVLAATAWLVSRAVRGPAEALVVATRRVAAGEYDAVVALAPAPDAPPVRNELAILTRAFGRMAVELRDREARIAAQDEELQAQNEELHAQQEELQSQNEELQAQQEELQSQNEEMHAQQEELLTQTEQLREQDARLRDAMESLAQEDRRKADFLALLSHELRNPLAPIVNGLHLLEQADPSAPQARRARQVIKRQVAHMVRLVDDLLDVTRINRGKIQLDLKEVDLASIVRHAAEDYGSTIASRGVALEISVPTGGPLLVRADPARLTQVVGNLLSNSAKFTPTGGEVSVVVEQLDGTERASIRVRDTGIGIPPEILPAVFQPFTQAETSLARTRGGLGLGLALVKALVELHGGTVRAESGGEGRGAEFTIELPLDGTCVAQRAPAAGGAAAGLPRRILLVEDNVDAAASLAEVLRLEGHEVELAHDGAEGVRKARSLRPDVVLCDVGLPITDGYEVARQLRQDPELAGVFLVALTGYALPDDVRRAREAGFDEHVTKPAGAEDVARALSRAPRGIRALES